MLNRRRFLSAGGTAAIATTLPIESIAQSDRLPPPIAKLQSLRSKARPITKDERRNRVDKARRLMAKDGMAALMIAPGTSLDYFTAVKWSLSERLFAMVLPAKGEPFFVCPAFEEDRAREQIANGPFDGQAADVRLWQEDENPFERLAQGLVDRGIASGELGVAAGILGIEEKTHYLFANGIANTAPAVRLVSGTPVTAGCRMIKSAHELELMRLASKVTWLAYRAAYESLKDAVGMSRQQFQTLISQAHAQLGFEGGASVQVGEFSALPHGSAKPQVIRDGTIILIDGGCEVGGYASDISRTFVLGKPTDKMKKIFEIERRAQDAALATAKPDVPCEAVDAAARKVITDAGYGPGYKFFTHRVGHGMGMDGHEWPYLVKGNKLPLAPGMTFSDEPGIYLPGEFGVRLEDDMVITEKGAELFTPQSSSLDAPFVPSM